MCCEVVDFDDFIEQSFRHTFDRFQEGPLVRKRFDRIFGIDEYRSPLRDKGAEQWGVDEVAVTGIAGQPILFGKNFRRWFADVVKDVLDDQSCQPLRLDRSR